MQDTDFDVNGNKVIAIYNPGRAVIPVINVNADMTASIGAYTVNLIPGDNKDYGFKLQSGSNQISITGTGHIEFIFRKEAV
jgi:hypothetical protein